MPFCVPLVLISSEGAVNAREFSSMQALSYLRSLPSIYWLVHYVCFKSLPRQYLAECDEVVLMKDGRVAEHGTHAQLMARGHDYFTLVTSVQQEVQFAWRKHRGHPSLQFTKHGLEDCCFRNVNLFLVRIFYEHIDLRAQYLLYKALSLSYLMSQYSSF